MKTLRGVPAKNKAIRKEEAIDRNSAFAELTPKQKLAKLDARLGKGVGAAKQRMALKEAMKA